MIEYNSLKPLIAIHIPKSAGTSFRITMGEWFKDKFYTNYYDEATGTMPKKHRLKKIFSRKFKEGICVYGHFNKSRGFGIQQYYPEVDQFITILRDPFEMVLSNYFYLQKEGWKFKDQSEIPKDDIVTYLREVAPNMLNHFPFELTIDNYKELINKYFIHVGITEGMEESVKIIADKLGFSAPTQVKTLNKTKRTTDIPYELKEFFVEKYPLENAIYNYAVENYNKR